MFLESFSSGSEFKMSVQETETKKLVLLQNIADNTEKLNLSIDRLCTLHGHMAESQAQIAEAQTSLSRSLEGIYAVVQYAYQVKVNDVDPELMHASEDGVDWLKIANIYLTVKN